MQTVLITGANGFVGTYLVRLLSTQYNVVATARSVDKLTIVPHVTYHPLDFTNIDAVVDAFSVYKPNIVVHAGAMSKPDDCELNQELAYATNVLGTRHLLHASQNLKSHFIFISTDFVFDGNKGMYSEDDEPGQPVNYYGKTKLKAEEGVRQYAFGWCILRTVLVYGKPLAGRQNILTVVAEHLKRGEPYNIFDDQVRTPTYVEDLADAIKAVIDMKTEGLFHISGEDILTPYEMAIATADYLNLDKNLLKKVDRQSFKQPALRPLKTGFVISKAKKELGYQPMSFAEGLKKTFS